MTLDEFFTELEQLPRDKYRFEVFRSGRIRVDRSLDCFCPITALCYEKTSRLYFNTLYLRAGRDLGLESFDTRMVANAADDRRSRLRPRLLKTLGLHEAT